MAFQKTPEEIEAERKLLEERYPELVDTGIDPTQKARDAIKRVIGSGFKPDSPLGPATESLRMAGTPKEEFEMSPEIKKYGYDLFGIKDLAGDVEQEIPFAPKEKEEASAQEYLLMEEEENIAPEVPVKKESKSAESPVQIKQPIRADKVSQIAEPRQTQADIENLIKQTEEEEDRAALWKQSAKLRDAVMGAGLGRIKQTDVSMYEDLQKKAQRPLRNLLLKEELEDKQQKRDPNSNISKLMRKSLEDLGVRMQGLENISAAQLEKLYPNLVSGITAKINAETRRDIASMSREDRAILRREKEDLKKAAAAKLSDRQLTPLVDVDSIIGNLDNVISMANEKFVGPLDARIPDVMTSGENAAFRSSVGRMVDSYRKAITGAGASAMELQKLEGRLPQPTDTLEQFKAKALSFRKELVRNRNTYLRTLKKQGKDVSEWETSVESEQSITPEERLKMLEEQLSKNSKRLEELKSKR